MLVASLAYNVHEGIIPPISSDLDEPANHEVKEVYMRLHHTKLKGVLTRQQSQRRQEPKRRLALDPVKKAAVEIVRHFFCAPNRDSDCETEIARQIARSRL